MTTDRSQLRVAVVAFVLASILTVGIALRSRAAAIGYSFDDYGHLAARHDAFPVKRAAWDLYAYVYDRPAEHDALRTAGNLPWWSHPHVQFAMFRPLASLLVALDDRIAPLDARFAHLHSFAWWCAAVLALAWCVSRRNRVEVALVTAAIFALSESNSLGVAWIANRTALVSIALGLLALGFHQRAIDSRRHRDTALATLFYALALAGGEYAIALYAYAIALEVIERGRSNAEASREMRSPQNGVEASRETPFMETEARHDAPPHTGRRLAIATALLVYIAIYALRGYGTRGSDAYVDPFREPARFLTVAPGRIGSLWLEAYGGLSLDRIAVRGLPGAVLFALGLVAATVFISLAWYACARFDAPSRRTIRAFAVASPFAMLPMSAGFPSPRLCIGTSIGVSVALGAIFVAAVRAWMPRPDAPTPPAPSAAERAAGRVSLSIAALLLAWQHACVVPSRTRLEVATIQTLGTQGTRSLLASPARHEMRPGTRALVLAAADPSTLFYAPTMWHLESRGELPLPHSWWVVSMVPGAQVLVRSADDTLEIRALQADMLTGPFEHLFRDAATPIRVGDRFVAGELTVTVREMGAVGPRWLTLHRDGGWGASEVVLLLPTPTGIVRIPMPRIGAGIPVPPAAIPTRMDESAISNSPLPTIQHIAPST